MNINAISSTHKLQNLQILRGLAALLVVVDHTIGIINAQNYNNQLLEKFSWSLGALGVTIFFVISGFIMLYSVGDKFGGIFSVVNFLVKRIIRIVPLYWIFTVLMVAKDILSSDSILLDEIIKSLFFIPYIANNSNIFQSIVGPGWTLNYEMYFYLLFSLSLFFQKNIGKNLIFIIFLSIIIIGTLHKSIFNVDAPKNIFEFYTDLLTINFALGVLLAKYINYINFKDNGFMNKLWLVIIMFFICLYEIIFYYFYKFDTNFISRVLLSFIAVFIVLIAASTKSSCVDYLSKTGVIIGEASFSIYLSHIFAFGLIQVIVNPRLSGGLPFLSASIILCTICGIICWYFIESH